MTSSDRCEIDRRLEKGKEMTQVASATDHVKRNAGLDDGDLYQLSLRKRVALQKSFIELLKENILASYVPEISYSKEYNSLVKDLRCCRVSHLNCSSHRDQNGIKKMINTMKFANPLMKRFTLISKYRKLKSQASTSLKSAVGASKEDSNPLQHLDYGKRNQQTNVDDTCNDFQVNNRSDPGEGFAEFHDVDIQSLSENLSGNVSSPNIASDNMEVSLCGLHDMPELQIVPEGCEDVQLLGQCFMPQSSSTQSLCIKCCSSGQLLNCSGDDCSRAIHERCLGLLDGIAKTGLFNCPFCSYKNVRMMFEKTKRKVQEARRDLLSFYDIDHSVNTPKVKISDKTMFELNKGEHPHLPSNQQFMLENVDPPNLETSDSKFTGDINQGFTQNEQNQLNVTVDIICKPSTETIETYTYMEVQDTPKKLNSEAGNEHESNRMTKYKQPVNYLGINGYDSLSFEVRTRHGNDDDICVNNRSNVATRDQLEIRNAHAFDAEKEQLSIKSNQRSILKGEGQCDHKAKRKALASKIKVRFAKRNRSDKASLTRNYQGATDNFSSRELRKTRHRQNLCSSERGPSSRRVMLNWTAEEEKILEEAMEKIPQNDSGSIPWKKILEYGRNVLHESRTAIDLKDKWRNMQKRKAKSSR